MNDTARNSTFELADVITWLDRASDKELDAVSAFLARRTQISLDNKDTEEIVNPLLNDKLLLPLSELIKRAKKPENVSELEALKLDDSAISNGKLKKSSAQDLFQYFIIRSGGIIKFNNSRYYFNKTMDNAHGTMNKPEDSTLRSWISVWKEAGYVFSVEGLRGAYTMTEKMVEEALKQNPYLEGFNPEVNFPPANRVPIHNPKA